MERTAPRFKLGKQSSLAPDRSSEPLDEAERKIDPRVIGSGTDLDGIKELIGFGTDANFRDVDGRTALHVATCKGFGDVVCFLLRNGISHFATDTVHYNPSDLYGWFESMLSEFNFDNSSYSSVVIYNTFTIVTN